MEVSSETIVDREEVSEQFQQQFLSLIRGIEVPRVHLDLAALFLRESLIRLPPEGCAVMDGPSAMISLKTLQINESNHQSIVSREQVIPRHWNVHLLPSCPQDEDNINLVNIGKVCAAFANLHPCRIEFHHLVQHGLLAACICTITKIIEVRKDVHDDRLFKCIVLPPDISFDAST